LPTTTVGIARCGGSNGDIDGGAGGDGGVGGHGGDGGTGGSAQGGGIITDSTTTIVNSTIAYNTVQGGVSGLGAFGGVGGVGGIGGAGGEGSGGNTGLPGMLGMFGVGGFGGTATGGGVAITSDPLVSISSSTIAYNSAYGGMGQVNGSASGGGISGSATLGSSIIASNTVGGIGSELAGAYTSLGYNLFENVDSGQVVFFGIGTEFDLHDISPGFDPEGLQDNGGPTQTIALTSDSAAIDHGGPTMLEFDQRGEGFPRTFNDIPDIGAFEFQIANNKPTVENTIPNQQATEDVLFTFTFEVNTFADADLDDELTYTATGLPSWLTFTAATRTFSGTPLNGDVTTGVTITVRATDTQDAYDETTFEISVTNTNDDPTVSHEIQDQFATEDDPFTFVIPSDTFADQDVGDTLVYTTSTLPEWLSFDPLTRTFTGTPANGDVTVTPVSITVTATDGSDQTASSTFDLTVNNVNDPPTLEGTISPQTAIEDEPFSFTIPSDTFIDIDVGDSLTYSADNLPAWLSFDPDTRTFSGTPTNSDVTLHSLIITIKVEDESEAQACTTFELDVVNVNDDPTVDEGIGPQTATEDTFFSFMIPEDAFADIDVGDSLTYTFQNKPEWLSFDPLTGILSGTPLNGDVTVEPITITVIATDESEASVSTTFELTVLNTNDAPFVDNEIPSQTAIEDELFNFVIPADTFGDVDLGDSLTYNVEGMPDWLFFNPSIRKFQGTPTNSDVTDHPIQITVRATDETGASTTTQFDLTVENANDAPTVEQELTNQTATEDAPFSYIVPELTFNDVDLGDSLTYTTSDLPAWLSFNPETREFTGTPLNEDVTSDPVSITVTATDESDASVSSTFELTVLNTEDPPYVENTFSDQTAEEDVLFTFEIPANIFQDPDVGDSLTYSATNLPAWLTFNPETQTFSGTPSQSDVTTDPIEITVTVEDESHETASAILLLSVVNTNDAPELVNPLENQTATEDAPFSYTVPLDTFMDADLVDTLTFSAPDLPAWLSFDPETQTFSGTPTNDDVTIGEPITITVIATDLAQATATATFTLTVLNTNDLPTVDNPIAPLTATEDTPFEYTIPENTFGDVDVGDTLAYHVAGLPGWLSFDADTLTFSGTPGNDDVGGPVQLSITVTDDDGNTATNIVDLTVINVNDAPTVVNAPGNQQAIEDSLFSFTLPSDTFNDIDVGQVLTYSATGLPSWLSFDPQTGIFSGTPDDTDTGSSPSTITVTADDSQGGTVSTTFQLSVTPVNDHTPVFTTGTQTVTLLEHSANSTIVATVAATDADLPPETLTYSITAGNTNGAFIIDPTTGVITVLDSTTLDFETNPSFTLTVQVTDNGTPTVRTATATVTVNLTQLPGPTITLNPNDGLFFINDSRAPVDPTATFTNQRTPETYEGAQLKVTIAAGRVRRDILRILPGNKISTKAKRVSFKGKEIGAFTGGNDRSPDLVITFNSSASTAAIDALVKQINFSAKGGIGETRAVTMQVLNLSGTESPISTRNIRVERLARSR